MFRPRLLLLLPAVLLAGEARYARLGEIEGRPDIQLHAADPWRPALRNAVVLDGAWIRTSPGSRAEVELDDGGAWRLDAAGLCEFSDYTRLSTGQRVTLISLDTGVAYFTGAAEGADSLVLAVPGAQATIRQGARVRLEAREGWSRIAVIEGAVTFSSPAAELEIREGWMVRVEPDNPARFFLYREFTSLESDAWSEAHDKALMSSSAGHVAAPPFGLADLDAAGAWIGTEGWGTVWKPRIGAGWAPFRDGKWVWYEALGYTWISAEPWGWLPYHYGRWTLDQSAGWVWVPGADDTFSPGDVYWLRGAKLAGWGPLAPGEAWDGRARPQLFLNAHTTFAPFAPDAREIDPAGSAAPREPPAAASFTAALPSPPLAAARLQAGRPVLRAGSTRIVPQLTGVTYGPSAPVPAGTAVAEFPSHPPAPQPVYVPVPEPPVEIYYPVPVSTGIIVVNPPDRDHDRRRRRDGDHAKPKAPEPEPDPVPRTEQVREERRVRTPAAEPAPVPAPAPAPLPRTEQVREQRRERAPDPPPAADAAPKSEPVSRGETRGRSPR